MISIYECTYCRYCVDNVLQTICPNCGVAFEKDLHRPKEQLKKYPPREDRVLKPVTENIYLQDKVDINLEKDKWLLTLLLVYRSNLNCI